MTRKLGPVRMLGIVLSVAAAAVAVAQELRKPKAARTWHGRVFGFVPYDFRLPTPERIRASLWNADDPRLLTGQPFGVGWSINLRRLWELATGRKPRG